jgi:predicted acetyltransferase
MPFLFSYGTLQHEHVQLATFGRRLDGERDELPGFAPSLVRIDDAAVAAALGRTHHANVTFSGRDDSRVEGTAFDVTDADLAAADAFERPADYRRIAATLASGKRAWLYVHASSATPAGIDTHEPMTLVWPAPRYLGSYVAALECGWSPDNLRDEAAREHLEQIAADADAFLASLVDREARGGPVTLPDGTSVPRLPGYHRWLWDGEFCGSIGFRWQPGTEALPPHCLGHIGYAVVPWKRGRGYATRALGAMLREAGREGLAYVDITTRVDNVASQRVIEKNAGVIVDEFVTPSALGGVRHRRYRVQLARHHD